METNTFHICSRGKILLQNMKLKADNDVLRMSKHKVSLGDSCQICQFSSAAGIQALD